MKDPAEPDVNAALVLAQQGTRDTRALQVLDPLVTVSNSSQQLHRELPVW